MVVTPSVGELLRSWRVRRRMSQLDLADLAEIGVKLLGQIEAGRSAASRDLVLRLAEQMGVPLRDRNALMTAAGYTSLFPQRPLDDPALGVVREGLEAMQTRYPKAVARDFDGQKEKVTEADALIAYLQMLGTLVDFKTYRADAPEHRR